MHKKIIFLKLGGSLITDKGKAETARFDVIRALLTDLNIFVDESPETHVLLGHGSGSFGHHAAAKYGTRDGVYDDRGKRGFIEVWRSARKLNEIVLSIGESLGLPLLSFPPSACVLAYNREVLKWATEPISRALEAGIIPVVYGDVVFDRHFGGTILSTEELFFYLAGGLQPKRVLLAGIESAVFADFPTNSQPIRHIDKDDILLNSIQGSNQLDVTGGMRAKVGDMQTRCRHTDNCRVEIFTAAEPGDLLAALKGNHSGTIIS